jgi:hypothetical protein
MVTARTLAGALTTLAMLDRFTPPLFALVLVTDLLDRAPRDMERGEFL